MRKNGDNDDESLKTLSETTMVYGGVDLRKKAKMWGHVDLLLFLRVIRYSGITLLSINQIYDVPVITLLSITV